MNLYIVESPLQLLCAYEAIHVNRNAPYQLLIRQTGRGLNDKHLINCANKLGLNYKIFVLHTESIYVGLLRNLFLLSSLYFKYYEKVYFGSFYSSALNFISYFIRRRELIYLDDGAATLRAQLEMSMKEKKVCNWFTFFNIEPLRGQNVIKHNFEKIKEKNKKYINKGKYFIGQPVSAMKGFSLEDYMRCVREIASRCESNEFLYYIPHRVENLDLINNIPNIKVVKPTVPIEIYFLENKGSIPKEIYSCYSTALITLPVLFLGIKATAVKNKYMIKNEIDFMYAYFLRNNISVVEL
ncbi:polysialyltransferase family glycosyltransferase [Acinetobacter courvalinii]|uniref:Glycosyltransferase 52 family protein n=1 Tax=Acinetobacter courvalinii TaxID=280147 RepID=N9RP12_9GAMM|nr:polysialyltransferase family glycosyltransferase [Acinetobacter courvalinii]ENX40932.1 hypothetical protein F888_00419 [Acinetobacter courvalinii]KAB0661353.1 hypothetical protein F7P77_02100 [Acinetobacter courvalinii]RSN79889.1 hypothetical protein EA770_16755 [Acinetobacter baumannii]GGH43658.1 hypothetical protein GCM10007354_32250 [Acinetobacter courvalinii]